MQNVKLEQNLSIRPWSAQFCYNVKNLEEILKLKPTIFLKNNDGRTAYDVAVECEHEEHAEILQNYAKNFVEK